MVKRKPGRPKVKYPRVTIGMRVDHFVLKAFKSKAKKKKLKYQQVIEELMQNWVTP